VSGMALCEWLMAKRRLDGDPVVRAPIAVQSRRSYFSEVKL
jgi:hypothetical protein